MDALISKAKVLSDTNRFRIVMMLMVRPLCVCELLEVLDIAGGTLSNHLKILRNSGLINQKKDGRWVEYYLADETSERFMETMGNYIQDWSQIKSDRKIINRISRDICSSHLKK